MNPWKQGFFLSYEHCALLYVVKMLGVRYNKRHNREFKRIRYEKEVRFYLLERIVAAAILAVLLLVPRMIGFAQQAKHTAVQDTIRSLATVYKSAEVFVRTSSGLNRKRLITALRNTYTLVTIDSDEQGARSRTMPTRRGAGTDESES